jgi:hypothetical protein
MRKVLFLSVHQGRVLGFVCANLLLSAGRMHGGDLGHAIVETAGGGRIEGMVSMDKAGLRVTDGAGATRAIGPEELRVAWLVKKENVVPPQPTAPGLRATYFNSKELGGDFRSRIDGKIDFAWGAGAPIDGINAERFSARWEGFLEARTAGNHVFHLLSNDGARLWVDGRLVVDEWHDQSDTEHSGTIVLEAGKRYPFRMEMYEQGGTATARLFWTPPGGQREIVPEDRFTQPDGNAPQPGTGALSGGEGQGLRARYFATRNLDGFSVERLDPEVNFNWGQGDPGVDAGIGRENFSVRWEGWLEGPLTGSVTFTVRADDGVRLWIDDRQIIDQWRDGSVIDYSGQIDLEKGKKYPVKLEYYENASEATVSLSWQANGLGKQIIPARFLNPGRAGDAAAPFPTRLHLKGGSILSGNLRSTDRRTVTIATGDGETAVPLRGIALLQFGEIPDDRLVSMLAGKPGCMMRDRDFFEAEFLGYEEGRLRFSSILFGLKTVELGPVLAIVTGTQKVRPAKYTVTTSSGWKVLVNEISAEGDEVKVLDNSFSRFALPRKAVEEIRGEAYGK